MSNALILNNLELPIGMKGALGLGLHGMYLPFSRYLMRSVLNMPVL